MILTIRVPEDTVKILCVVYDTENCYEKDPVPVPFDNILNIEKEE